MSEQTHKNVRDFLISLLKDKALPLGKPIDGDIGNDFDFYEAGLVDSLGLLELLASFNAQFSTEIDFEEIDPDEMTIVGPLCKFVADWIDK